jgi:hypothetical protein
MPTDFDLTRAGEVKLSCLSFVGDHPGLPKEVITYRTPLTKRDLYIAAGSVGWVTLFPLLVARNCRTCKSRETFFLDKWDRDRGVAMRKSFERGHEEETDEVVVNMAGWLRHRRTKNRRFDSWRLREAGQFGWLCRKSLVQRWQISMTRITAPQKAGILAVFFAAFTFAHRARWAATILLRALADSVHFFSIVTTLPLSPSPLSARSDLTVAMRRFTLIDLEAGARQRISDGPAPNKPRDGLNGFHDRVHNWLKTTSPPLKICVPIEVEFPRQAFVGWAHRSY